MPSPELIPALAQQIVLALVDIGEDVRDSDYLYRWPVAEALKRVEAILCTAGSVPPHTAALCWVYDRLTVEGGMTPKEQAATAHEIAATLVGNVSPASTYVPNDWDASKPLLVGAASAEGVRASPPQVSTCADCGKDCPAPQLWCYDCLVASRRRMQMHIRRLIETYGVRDQGLAEESPV